jgi:hypothetical protein
MNRVDTGVVEYTADGETVLTARHLFSSQNVVLTDGAMGLLCAVVVVVVGVVVVVVGAVVVVGVNGIVIRR